MSEQIWLDPRRDAPHLANLFRGRVGPRKARLFAVACCRRVAHLLPDERSRRAVEVAELYADRQVKREELVRAHADAQAARDVFPHPYGNPYDPPSAVSALWAADTACWAAEPTTRPYPYHAARSAALTLVHANLPPDVSWAEVLHLSPGAPLYAPATAEMAVQLLLLRDVYGNPTRPPTPLDRSVLKWNGGTVGALARTIYQERTFDQLPVLADALEEAGCGDGDVLGHLRSSGPHARGCWALDLVLGKR